MEYPKFQSAFSKLGNKWVVPEDITKYLEEFVCVMYGYVQKTSVSAGENKNVADDGWAK